MFRYKYYFKYCVFALILLFGIRSAKSQGLSRLKIVESSVTCYLSMSQMFHIDIFGRYRYALYVSKDINNLKPGPYASHIMSLKSTDSSCLFSTIDTKTGQVQILPLNSPAYFPISFVNNDTLLVLRKSDNIIMGYKVSDKTVCNVSLNKLVIFQNVKFDVLNNNYKMNKDFNRVAILNHDRRQYLNILSIQANIPIKKTLQSTTYFKTWKCSDFFWLDDDNLILLLMRFNKTLNDVEYSQKIYNVKSDKFVNLKLPENSLMIDDFYNGLCLVRTMKTKKPFLIYSIKAHRDFVKLTPIYSIVGMGVKTDIPTSVAFISNAKIIQTTDVIGETGILRLSLNFKMNTDFRELEIRTQ